jgi:uncharacterized protein
MGLYLDIETDWDREITVIGLYHRARGFWQLCDREVTGQRLLERLPDAGRIYTFNGHCFDLPVIKRRLGIDLRQRYQSVDLRYVCQRRGLTGGQKAIEQRLGIARRLPGLDGRDAVRLWQHYRQYGDEGSLRLLLAYNREDVMNLVRLGSLVRQRTGGTTRAVTTDHPE